MNIKKSFTGLNWIAILSLIILFQQVPFVQAEKNIGKDEVRFIIFGDSQFGNPPQFERMIHEAEMLRPDFVIQVGDLIKAIPMIKTNCKENGCGLKEHQFPNDKNSSF